MYVVDPIKASDRVDHHLLKGHLPTQVSTGLDKAVETYDQTSELYSHDDMEPSYFISNVKS